MSSATLLTPRAAELLPQASSFAAGVDRSFQLALWFCVFFYVLLVGGLLALLLVRRTSDAAPQRLPRWFFGTGAGLAALLFAAFFVQGAHVWADMQVIPRGALMIRVARSETGWSFTYPNGFVSEELHLPLDAPVKFALAAANEPYTLSIPAFRLQLPVALGQDREAWVQPTLAGEFVLRTTRLPVRDAAHLDALAIVHEQGGFEKWYQGISGPPLDLPPIELGQRSYQMRGCTQCHSIDGSKLVGPSFAGFAAREHVMNDGAVVEADDAYIKESVLDPQAKVLQGFEPVMPSFRGRVSDLEIAGLAAYIKSLK